MPLKHLLHLIVFTLLLIGRPAYPASPASSPEVTLAPSVPSPAFGDSLTIICTVRSDNLFTLGDPLVHESETPLDISLNWVRDNSTKDSFERSYGFLIYVVTPDSMTFGPVAFHYTDADGDSAMVMSKPLQLLVVSQIANPEKPEPARPNRGPIEIAAKGISPRTFLIAVILIALIAWILYRHYKKKHSISAFQEVFVPLDELEEFDKIRKLKLQEQGRIKELYIIVSDTMRAFLHRNLDFDAMYETSYEILTHIKSKDIDEKCFTMIRDIFVEADMVKFAKYTPSSGHSKSIIDRAIEPVKTILEMKRIEEERRVKELELSSAQTAEQDMEKMASNGEKES